MEQALDAEESGSGPLTVSVIAAVRDGADYLDRFFRSLYDQTLARSAFLEIIVVDDGSTDESWERLIEWQTRHPDTLKPLRQPPTGIAAARNLAMGQARGKWLAFVDADDFVAPDYLEKLLTAATCCSAEATPVLVRGSLHTFVEAEDRVLERHAFKSQVSLTQVALAIGDPAWHLQVPVVGLLILREFTLRHALEFDTTLTSHGEDLAFVLTLLSCLSPDDRLCNASAAIYYHRQRSDRSAADARWNDLTIYDAQFRSGPLRLLDLADDASEPLRSFIHRSVLYHLLAHFKRFADRPDRFSRLPSDIRETYVQLMRDAMTRIPEQIVSSPGTPGLRDYLRTGILAFYYRSSPRINRVFFKALDPAKELLEVRYYSPIADAPERLYGDGRRIAPLYGKTRTHTLFGEVFVFERLAWIPARRFAELEVYIGNKPSRVSYGDTDLRESHVELKSVVSHFITRRPATEYLLDDSAFSLSRLNAVRQRYENCWVLTDRDTIADDNAEHLYRYILRHQPQVNAWFALSRASPDWPRLERDGFRLLDYGSADYRAALLHAKHLVSSHTLGYMLKGLNTALYRELVSYKVTFLQHGVIKDDLSLGLNRQPMDLFITSTLPEYNSIVFGPSYRFSSKQVALTGLPRHDGLIGHSGPAERLILVQPTWRGGLVGALTGNGSEREVNPFFHESEFSRTWREFLQSERLRALVKQQGCRVVFSPHPNLRPYIDGFELPDYIEIGDQTEGSMQNLFLNAAMMITDYSSVMFEMALLRKPMIYYQFDVETFFGGGHTYERGYFSYKHDGFGPVVSKLDDLLYELEKLVENGFRVDAPYGERMNRTFVLNDTRNSERVFRAICGLDEPVQSADVAAAEIELARHALRSGDLSDAQRAWQRILSEHAAFDAEATLALVEIATRLRDFGKAEALLDGLAQRSADETSLLRERLRLAVARKELDGSAEILARLALREGSSDDGRTIAVMAAAHRILGNIDRADELTDTALLEREVRVERAREMLASSRMVEAEELLAGGLDDLHADGVTELARIYRLSGRVAQAARLLTVLGPTASFPERDAERAAIATSRGDWQLAAKLWRRATQWPDPTDEMLAKLAQARRRVGNFVGALDAIEGKPSDDVNLQVLHQRALALSAGKAWKEAVDAWDELLAKRPTIRPIAYLHLAEALINDAQDARARDVITYFDGLVLNDEFAIRLRARLEKQYHEQLQTHSSQATPSSFQRGDQ